MLVKAAYTGIAVVTIHGKTLHTIAKLPLNVRPQRHKKNVESGGQTNDT
jgi:hypothetical protein